MSHSPPPMRAITLCLGFSLLLPLGVAAQTLSTNNIRRLSMDEVVRSAIDKNLRLQFQRLNVQIARDALFNVEGYYDPTLDIRATYSSSATESTVATGTGIAQLGGENTTHSLT